MAYTSSNLRERMVQMQLYVLLYFPVKQLLEGTGVNVKVLRTKITEEGLWDYLPWLGPVNDGQSRVVGIVEARKFCGSQRRPSSYVWKLDVGSKGTGLRPL